MSFIYRLRTVCNFYLLGQNKFMLKFTLSEKRTNGD